jgi:pimeloyl-ACP methyl ester carboxylesterase
LIGGWTVAARLQPSSFSPMADTVSALAAIGATDRWVMSLVFVAVGVGYIVTGLALRLAALAGRLILIAGAIAGMLVAANPEHPGYTSVPHFVCAALGFAGLAAWPLAAWRRGPSVPWALRRAACFSAVAVQLVLISWFAVELVSAGGQVGLAERLVGAGQALWLLAVVLSCRAARGAAAAPSGVPAGN